VLGWLYVAEGSTLGGAVLRRRLRLADCDSVDLASALQGFHPYAEGPGPMWRRYVDVLERWTAAGPGRGDAVADAAVHSFAVLEQWVVPTRQSDVTGLSA
jgi:heme oxygenase